MITRPRRPRWRRHSPARLRAFDALQRARLDLELARADGDTILIGIFERLVADLDHVLDQIEQTDP